VSTSPNSVPKYLIDQAYERAKARLIANIENDDDLPNTPPRRPPDTTPQDATHLDPIQLRRVLYDPVRWILILAQGLALDDAADTWAVHRVRRGFSAWLAGEPIALRRDDLLTVCSLVFAALDPDVVDAMLHLASEALIQPGTGAVPPEMATEHSTGASPARRTLRMTSLACGACCPHGKRSD